MSLQSPDTAFIVISLDEDMPPIEEVAETVVETLRADYPDLEAEACVDTVAGQMAIGHNIEFMSLDLTNTCWTRSFDCPDGTALLLCQVSDIDAPQEPILRAICASLRVAGAE